MQVTKDSASISAAIISIPEAMALSNLSQDALLALVKDGSIKGRKIGSALKIYRMSLASYLAKSQKVESPAAPERVGAIATQEDSDLRDEVWGLKQALAESQGLLASEQRVHEQTKQQLANTEKKLTEALNQIEHMMMHHEASMRPQPIDLPATQDSSYSLEPVIERPSFMQRLLGWLGLR